MRLVGRPVPLSTPNPMFDLRDGAPTTVRSSVFLLVGLALVVALLLYYAQYSGSARWMLGVLAVSGFALFAWALILRRTADPAPLVGLPAREAVYEGELGALAATIRRASRGLLYSQVLVVSRVRAAFLERARLAMGLSPEAMATLLRSPADLHRMFGDPVLERFVRSDGGEFDDRHQWVLEARERGDFSEAIRDVLARIEAWR